MVWYCLVRCVHIALYNFNNTTVQYSTPHQQGQYGAYTVVMDVYQDDRSMAVVGSEWLVRPEGFVFASLVGYINNKADKMYGTVSECNDGPFSLYHGAWACI